MNEELKHLIDETIAITGAAPPGLMDEDSPVFDTSARSANDSLYLIGLVGGKDVGKSSLVNALVGQPISKPTSHGPGTESVIAYAHKSVVDPLREILSRELAENRYSIVPHRIEELRNQVLLDLPDIDSKYGDHIQITRRMLKHMLFPLWIQSVEKYADQQPQQLLKAVAEGNDPRNFLFCLNKADQLSASDAQQLREDFASRIARVLELPQPPRVFLISATRPQEFDLPSLRQMLSRQRSSEIVLESKNLAQQRQDRSIFGWVQRQRLPERARQIKQLEHDAEELLHQRVAAPLLDTAIPRLLDDPGHRMSMLAPATRQRLARWPIVNAIDALLWPLLALVQKNLAASSTGSADPDVYLDRGMSVSSAAQSAWAQLQQLHPELVSLESSQKLWEPLHADLAAADLQRRFAAAIRRQREEILQHASSRWSIVLAPLRWLLTIGALLWFPIVQPILAIVLANNTWDMSKATLRTAVDVLSVAHLLECTTFLLMWFGILWVLLRWNAQRSLSRLIDRWKFADSDDELSLAGQTMQWIDEMIQPIRRRRERIESLIQRAEELRNSLNLASPAKPKPASIPSEPAASPA